MAQVPVLPYLMAELHADMSDYGWLQTFFSVMQMIGGLLAGAPPYPVSTPCRGQPQMSS
jgi:predicted MFS family arabinose efflux permease